MALDRVEALRREAARCLEHAQQSADPKVRQELISMAARFHELAISVQADFDAILRTFSDLKMAPEKSEPISQQQQQIQPKKEA